MNLFVGGLSWNITEEQLNEHFAKFGEVSSVKIIMDKQSGRSKGFGFVEMPNAEEGQKAIDALNGSEMDGRKVGVNVAEERKPSTGGGKKDFKRRDSRDNNRENNRW